MPSSQALCPGCPHNQPPFVNYFTSTGILQRQASSKLQILERNHRHPFRLCCCGQCFGSRPWQSFLQAGGTRTALPTTGSPSDAPKWHPPILRCFEILGNVVPAPLKVRLGGPSWHMTFPHCGTPSTDSALSAGIQKALSKSMPLVFTFAAGADNNSLGIWYQEDGRKKRSSFLPCPFHSSEQQCIGRPLLYCSQSRICFARRGQRGKT